MSAVKKLEWLDVAKGLGIILVVAGHSIIDGGPYAAARGVIYTFHMPLFFILSGYTVKNGEFWPYMLKKLQGLIVPYTAYLFLIGLPVAYFSHASKHKSFPIEFLSYFYGGAHLVTYMTVFWFVTCLFFALLLFQYILTKFKNLFDPRLLCAICACYALAYAISWKIHFPTPLAIGVVPMAVTFLWIGKAFSGFEQKSTTIIAASSAIILLILAIFRQVPPFAVDMKNALYGPPLVATMLATALSFLIIFASKVITRVESASKFLQLLGRASITIMFLSQPIVLACQYLGINYFLKVTAAVLAPVALHMLFGKNRYTALVFLGRNIPAPAKASASPVAG